MQVLKQICKGLTLAVAALWLAACHSSSNNSESFIRVVHAVSDAPRVNVYLDDAQVLSDFDFRSGTGVLAIDPGTYRVRVEAIVPGGNVDVIDVAAVEFAKDTQTTVYASGDVTDMSVAPLLVSDPVDPVAAGSARATVVHAAPNVVSQGVSEVAVFVTAPGADISASAPLGTFEFGDTLGPVEVPAGDYQIRVAVVPGSGSYSNSDVVYDAGTVTLPEGADLQLAAVINTTNGPSPASLIVLDGTGSSDLFDVGTGALVRVVHGSPDAPPVDVVVNNDFMPPAVVGAVYTDVTGFLGPLPAASYNFKVVPTMTMTAVIDADAALDAGLAYTVIASDVLANITALILVDDNRRVATAAKLRIVHGSPAAGNVDIYLLAPGTLPSDSGVTPAFSDVPFGAETGFFDVAAGTYDVYVTPTGDNTTLAISATGIPLNGEGIYTAIAGDATGGGAPLQLILADDFTAG
ncbi:MAG: DUF4397 domain-containing protein [Gammaproteobacteria bacterium]|nr:DUF4397 domain-containing protein [Gammaproteobacteria bacterium]